MEAILEGLFSNVNAIRRHSEDLLAGWKSYNISDFIVNLVSVITKEDGNENLRVMSCILLRGYTIRESHIWSSIDEDQFCNLRNGILNKLPSESVPYIQRKIVDLLGPLAKLRVWPEIYTAIIQLSQSENLVHHHLSLYLLDNLCEYSSGCTLSNRHIVIPIIESNLDSKDVKSQALACKALSSFLHEDSDINEEICCLLNKIPPALASCINAGLQNEAIEILTAISRLAVDKSEIFQYSWTVILESLAQICLCVVDIHVDDMIKILALEIATTLLTSKKSNFCRNDLTMTTFLQAIMKLMILISYDETDEDSVEFLSTASNSFLNGDEFDENENSSNLASAAAHCLRTFAFALEPTSVLHVCLPYAGTLIISSNWTDIRAALLILQTICEGTKSSLYTSLPHIVPVILTSIAHEHPRVQYAALSCMYELIDNFNGDILPFHPKHEDNNNEDEDEEEDECQSASKSIQVIFPFEIPSAICTFLQTPSCSKYLRLMHQAIRCLISFFHPDRCSNKLCKPFAANLLDFSLNILSNEHCPLPIRQESASLIANVSVLSSTSVMKKRYALITEELKKILITAPAVVHGQSIDTVGFEILKGKCLECFALLGKSVGKEVFYADGMQMMHFLVGLHEGGLDYSSQYSSYIIQTCARMASILEDDIQPFLGSVLPPLLDFLSKPLIVETSENSNDDDDVSVGRMKATAEQDEVLKDYQRGQGEVVIKFNAHQITEKEAGLRAFYQYCLDIPQLVSSFAPQAVLAVAHIINAQTASDDLYLISCAILCDCCKYFFLSCDFNNQENIIRANEIVIHSISHMLLGWEQCQAVKSHQITPSSSVHVILDGLREFMKVLYDSKLAGHVVLTSDIITECLSTIRYEVAMWIQRRFVDGITQTREDDIQVEENIWNCLIDLCGWLIKFCGSNLASHEYFRNDFLPFLESMVSSGNDSPIFLQLPMCTLLDIVAYIPEISSISANISLPLLLKNCKSEELVTTCIAGFGVIAMHCDGDSILKFHSDFISRIIFHASEFKLMHEKMQDSNFTDWVRMVKEDLDDDEGLLLKDNSISSLFKLLIFSPSVLNIQQTSSSEIGVFMAFILSNLPLSNDLTEARIFHDLFVNILSQCDNRIFGIRLENTNQILKVLVELLVSVGEMESVAFGPGGNADFWDDQVVNEETINKIVFLLKAWHGGALGDLPKSSFVYAMKSLTKESQRLVSCLLST